MLVLGLTGVPVGGKSTVARLLQEKGATWLDADRLAQRCLALPQIRQKVEQRFGSDVLNPGGFVVRSCLAAKVFGDDERSLEGLRYLERLVHPPTHALLFRRMCRAAQRGSIACVLDVPLLFESGWDVYCDLIWCIDVPLAIRLPWLRSRGWTQAQLENRERRQLAIGEKKRLSNEVLNNVGDRFGLASQVDYLWTKALAKENPNMNSRHCHGVSKERRNP